MKLIIDLGGFMFIRHNLKYSLLLIVLILCYSQVSAKITLKRNFFTGWKYSIDGEHYKKVGQSGADLYYEMKGNEEAQLHMKKYKTAKTWATVTGIPGGFFIGWPIGGYIGSGGDWKDSYTTMIIIGTPLSVISILFEGSATRNLKKAVNLYNNDDKSLGFRLDFKQPETGQPLSWFIGLKYEF